MTKYNPTGLVRMNMRGMSEDAFIEHAKRAKYLSCVCIDANHMARRLHEEAGVLYSVSRIFNFDPHPPNDKPADVKAYAAARYKDLQNLRADAKSPNVHYYINNEGGFEKRDFMMYEELIRLSAADPAGPIGLVFWNGASGAVKTGFWGEQNQWKEMWALSFMTTMHHHRNVRLPSGALAFLLGVHSYTSQYPLIAVNGGRERKTKDTSQTLWARHDAFLNGDKQVDWRLAQDHIGRDYQGIMYALGYKVSDDGTHFVPDTNTWKGLDGEYINCPPLLASEAWTDNMNDVAKVHADELELMPGLDTPRGYRGLEKTWAKPTWFPGKPMGYTNAYCLQWTYNAVHAQTGVVVAVTYFCEGQTSDQWKSYNVNGDTDYLKYMESDAARVDIPERFLRAPVVQPPVDPPPPPPTGDGLAWYKATATALKQFGAPIYADKTFNHKVTTIAQNATLELETVFDALLNQWRRVKWDKTLHYVNQEDWQFTPNEPPLKITAQDTRFDLRRLVALIPDVKIYKQTALGQIYETRINATGAEFDIIPPELHTPLERSHLIRKQVTKGFIVVRMGSALGFVESDQVAIQPTDVPPPPPPVEIDPFEAIVTWGDPTHTNIRAQPRIEVDNIIGQLRNGEHITVMGIQTDSDGTKWTHMVRHGHDAVPTLTGYISSVANVTVHPVAVPPPPCDTSALERALEQAEKALKALQMKELATTAAIGRISRALTDQRTKIDSTLNQMQAPMVELANIEEELTALVKGETLQ